MRLAIASVLLLFSAACATSARSGGALSTEGLSGCYTTHAEKDGGRLLLTLNQDGSYVAFVIVGLGIWGKATGNWSLGEDGLFFGPSNETKDWHHYMHAIGIERSGPTITLIDGPDRLTKAHASECGL